MTEPTTVAALIEDTEKTLNEPDPKLFAFGAPFLMALGFTLANLAVKFADGEHGTAALFLFLGSVLAFRFWRWADAYARAKEEMRRLVQQLQLLEAVEQTQQRVSVVSP